MAKFTWMDKYGFHLGRVNFGQVASAKGYETSPTSFKAFSGYGGIWWDEFTGHGFIYDANGVPIDGTITDYTSAKAGRVVAMVTGTNVSVSKLFAVSSTSSLDDDVRFCALVLSGNDQIIGSKRGDSLYGYKGNDTIVGGLGLDNMYGGKGADRFVFNSAAESKQTTSDYIRDFSRTQGDRIDLEYRCEERLRQPSLQVHRDSRFLGQKGRAALLFVGRVR